MSVSVQYMFPKLRNTAVNIKGQLVNIFLLPSFTLSLSKSGQFRFAGGEFVC